MSVHLVKFKGDYVPVGSSGLSAGAALEDAILQGLFEVIEHDAWCIGQSNKTKLPIIDYSTVKKESHARLTYTQAAAWLADETGGAAPGQQALLPQLQNLASAYRALLAARHARGAVELDSLDRKSVV